MFYEACDNPIANGAEDSWYDLTSDEYRRYNLTRDPKTVQWWSEQTTEAQAAFTDPVDLRDALQRFGHWLNTVTNTDRPRINPVSTDGKIDGLCPLPVMKWEGLRLWAHGGAAQSSFDVAILYAAYEAVNLPVPWHYRAPRDTRTAFDMANVGDHSTWMQQFNHGTAHHALDDAISQARAVCAAYERLRIPTREHRVGTVAMQQYADIANGVQSNASGWDMIGYEISATSN